jgi:hypothetical protein
VEDGAAALCGVGSGCLGGGAFNQSGRDLRVSMWSLSRSDGGFWVEVASWIRLKALSLVVAGANSVDVIGRRFLLEGVVVMKLLPLP